MYKKKIYLQAIETNKYQIYDSFVKIQNNLESIIVRLKGYILYIIFKKQNFSKSVSFKYIYFFFNSIMYM